MITASSSGSVARQRVGGSYEAGPLQALRRARQSGPPAPFILPSQAPGMNGIRLPDALRYDKNFPQKEMMIDAILRRQVFRAVSPTGDKESFAEFLTLVKRARGGELDAVNQLQATAPPQSIKALAASLNGPEGPNPAIWHRFPANGILSYIMIEPVSFLLMTELVEKTALTRGEDRQPFSPLSRHDFYGTGLTLRECLQLAAYLNRTMSENNRITFSLPNLAELEALLQAHATNPALLVGNRSTEWTRETVTTKMVRKTEVELEFETKPSETITNEEEIALHSPKIVQLGWSQEEKSWKSSADVFKDAMIKFHSLIGMRLVASINTAK